MKICMYLLSYIIIFISINLCCLTFKYKDIISIRNSEKKSDVVVCFIDNFETKDDKIGHGNKVYDVYNHFIDKSNVVFLESSEFSFMSLKDTSNVIESFYKSQILNNCDIVNYSMINQNRSKEYLDFIHNFLIKFNGLLVVSSGNEGRTSSASEWSELKSLYPESDIFNNLYIVSQGFVYESPYNGNKNLIITRSYGSEVDYVVDRELTTFENDDYDYIGSSFSAPFFTAFLYDKISNKNYDFINNISFDIYKNKKVGVHDNNLYMVLSKSDSNE